MSQQTNYNERSWAIDLITEINIWCLKRDINIKRAGGELSVSDSDGSLFPDVLLFGDKDSGLVLQGWELKMPDTPINDSELIANAVRKANALDLNSFVVWNVTTAALYIIKDGHEQLIKVWDDLSFIRNRSEVRAHLSQIVRQLHIILDDLNIFLENGSLKPSDVVHSLTNEAILERLLRHSPIYAEALKKRSYQDHSFDEQATLWWISAKNEHPRGTDRWLVLANVNLVALFNKFVFAHMLKNFTKKAWLIDGVNMGSTAAECIQLFEDISRNADFWNVFGHTLGDELIPKATLRDFIAFNELLKQFHIEEMGSAIAQNVLDGISMRSTRKLSGQFSTPPNLADLLTSLTILDPARHAIDPCCGTGTIARSIKSYKQSHGQANPLETVWASDKFSLPLQVATLRLVRPEDMGRILRVFQADASSISTDQVVKLFDPNTGQELPTALPEFGYILSNLPFVNQGDLEVLNPKIKSINTEIKSLVREHELGDRSDLYAYLPFYFWSLLEENGKMGLIVSNSWQGTEWGKNFWALLSRFFIVEAVLTSGKGRWFRNAKVVTNILILRKRLDPRHATELSITKYATLNVAIEDLDEETCREMRALLANSASYTDPRLTVRSHPQNEIDLLYKFCLPSSALFTDLSWLKDVQDKLVSINTLFNVNRGDRRGWDAMFYPSQPNDIEKEYLFPVLLSSRTAEEYTTYPEDTAFCCAESKAALTKKGHLGALRWIESFEHARNTSGEPLIDVLAKSAKSGTEWYTLLPHSRADFFCSINPGDRLFIGKLEEAALVNQRLVCFTKVYDMFDDELVHALLNSSLTLFFLEALGFGRGEGALDLNATKIKDGLHVLDPSLISTDSAKTILHLFRQLKQRGIRPIQGEFENIRKEFDNAVLAAFGLDHLQEKIEESLLSLYRIRSSVNN
jgi:hypothetical protein